jgi:hypothetical protein
MKNQNYITTNHRGGIGNVMFKLAASISLAIYNNVDYIFSNEFIRISDLCYLPGSLGRPATQGHPDYRVYYSNILRGITFIDRLPGSYMTYTENDFHYIPIQYQQGSNLLLDGYFQSEKYFENNKSLIFDLYCPTEDIKNQIKNLFPDIHDFASLHVRRGDYLQFPSHHPLQTKDYYEEAVNRIGIDKTFLVFSDDLEGCKELLDFIPNKIFYTSNIDWMDMYTMSMCNDNIICNSTFSWWGAWLNENPNKKVISPTKWFGPAYAHCSTQDLIPESWQRI